MISPERVLTEDLIRDQYSTAKWCHDTIEKVLCYSVAHYVPTDFPSEEELIEKLRMLKVKH